MSGKPLRVLLADDHAAFRGLVRRLIDSTTGLEIADEVATGLEAVKRAADVQPDVIVMDIEMPGLNGILATREIVTRSPHVGVLILTARDDGESLCAALHAGARGYLIKTHDPQGIVRAIQAVGRGEAIFAPPMARTLIRLFGESRLIPLADDRGKRGAD